MPSQLAAYVEAIDGGQHHIENDQVWLGVETKLPEARRYVGLTVRSCGPAQAN
jgi:hypothetical protein